MGYIVQVLCTCSMHMHRHFYFQETLSKGREIWYTDTVQGVLFDAEFLEVLWCSLWGCIVRVRTCKLVGQLCRESNPTMELKHTIFNLSLYLRFWPKAVQSSSAGLGGSHWGQPLNPNSQVTRIMYQLKIHWGCRFCGVPAARARDEEDVLTWGPPVKVNFELATPNSVHGCTLARPTWRRMKKGAGVYCARAVHV